VQLFTSDEYREIDIETEAYRKMEAF
jgi:hypothetical protein